jgi:hypothetical protein
MREGRHGQTRRGLLRVEFSFDLTGVRREHPEHGHGAVHRQDCGVQGRTDTAEQIGPGSPVNELNQRPPLWSERG